MINEIYEELNRFEEEPSEEVLDLEEVIEMGIADVLKKHQEQIKRLSKDEFEFFEEGLMESFGILVNDLRK